MKENFLFLSCDEAQVICDKAQYGEATSWERIKLMLRLSWCHITKAYSNRNDKLTQTINKANLYCLKNSERKKIEKEFEKELPKHQ